MTTKGNTANLAAATQRKREAAAQRADQGIRELVKRGEPITFRSVARTGGCSIDFLYRSPDLRRRIETLRAQQEQGAAPTRPEPQPGSPNSVIRTLTHQLSHIRQRHRDEVAELKAALAAAQGENIELRRQLGRRSANARQAQP